MEIRIERGCGLDVHQATVVACVLVYEGGKRSKVVRTFRTMHASLLELRAWLEEQGVKHATMEGTGVYWRPVYEVLEGNTSSCSSSMLGTSKACRGARPT